MTKDSRRSSIAGPAAPSPQNNDTELPHEEPENPSAINDTGETSTNEPPNEKSAESQTGTPANTSEDNASTTALASYGTRSRHRTGTTRINYAEDKELDFDVEATSSKDNNARKHTKSSESTGAVETTSLPNGARRTTANDAEGASLQNGHKESSTTTASVTAANGTSQPASKKRKIAGQAPGASSTATQSQTASSPAPVTQATSSKSYPAAQLVPGFRETNMLGFERCRGQLKNKVLIADDGTRLQVNGRTGDQLPAFTRD